MLAETGESRRTLLAEGAAHLQAAGLPNPRREAVQLWEELTGESASARILQLEQPAHPSAITAFRSGIARRAGGEPLAYVTGTVGFRMLTLGIDRRALIPRPETEGLVDLLLSRVAEGKVADLGTGSGCLALSLASEGRFSMIVGVDLASDALQVAKENSSLVGSPVQLVQGDLCAPLAGASFDALISNPPYLTIGEYDALNPGVRDWEPKTALVSGPDGMDATGRLLEQGREVLKEGGWMALEIDCTRATDCARRAVGLGWSDVAIQRDLFGRERYLLARRSGTP